MAQCLGPDFKSRILYNDLRGGKYCSVILDVETGGERILPVPCYTVSADGRTALSLDFSRLHNLRRDMDMRDCRRQRKGLRFRIRLLSGNWTLRPGK